MDDTALLTEEFLQISPHCLIRNAWWQYYDKAIRLLVHDINHSIFFDIVQMEKGDPA